MRVRWRVCGISLGLGLALATACDDSPTNPGAVKLEPPTFLLAGMAVHCRMWPYGLAQELVEPAGYWDAPCRVPIHGSPTPWFDLSSPDSLVFTWDSPVYNVWGVGGFGGLGGGPCPTTWMRYKLYRPDGSLIVEGTFDQTCGTHFRPTYSDPTAKLVVTAPSPMPPEDVNGRSVSFTLEYDVPCAPTGEFVLDDGAVRTGLLNELALSRPNADGSGRKERRGFIYHRDDGSYFLQPLNDPNASMCGTGIIGLPTPPVIPGATFVGEYHTHPSKHRELLTGCPGQKPNEVWRANRKARTGGGSDADWDYATFRQKSMYVIDYDRHVWRLDANTISPSARKSNPNHWKFPNTISDCLVRA